MPGPFRFYRDKSINVSVFAQVTINTSGDRESFVNFAIDMYRWCCF
jgi:hypothetical protein